MSKVNPLVDASYVSFATFRKTGVQVATPVWCAGDGDDLFIFSDPEAGKVKRLRNSPRSKLAVCDVRGKVLGPWSDATAVIISDPALIARALAALRKKYGWQMRLLDMGSKVTGKFHRRTYIQVHIHDQ